MPVRYDKDRGKWMMGSKEFTSKAAALRAYRAYLAKRKQNKKR